MTSLTILALTQPTVMTLTRSVGFHSDSEPYMDKLGGFGRMIAFDIPVFRAHSISLPITRFPGYKQQKLIVCLYRKSLVTSITRAHGMVAVVVIAT